MDECNQESAISVKSENSEGSEVWTGKADGKENSGNSQVYFCSFGIEVLGLDVYLNCICGIWSLGCIKK